MLKKNQSIHIKIVNWWLSFILLLIIISNLPHQVVPVFSWLNCSVYFLIFLQTIALYKLGNANKNIFLNIGIFAFLHSLSFTDIFVGENFLYGDDYLRYFFFEYKYITLSFLPAFCVIFITLKYIFKTSSDLKIYLFSFALTIPTLIWNYFPFIADKEFILEVEDALLYKSVILFDFLPLFFLVFFGALLYKFDLSLGEHINTLMICFFIVTIMDITNLIGTVYNIIIFKYTQYVLLISLSFFSITLFRLINYSYSDFGQLYSSIISYGDVYGVPIKRKKNAFIQFLKIYFHEKRNSIGFSMLLLTFFINYFSNSIFIKINMTVLSIGMFALLFYVSALYQKRLNSGNFVNFKNKINT